MSTTTQSPIPSIISGSSFLSTALHISPASSINFNVWVLGSPLSYNPLSSAHVLIKSNLLALPFPSLVPIGNKAPVLGYGSLLS